MHEITNYFQRSGRNSLLKIMHELNWMRRGSTVIKMTDLSDLPARRIIIYYDLLLPSFWAKTKGG